ncbi:MAG: hypothetical protein VX798_16770 [Bacteroidota bacterium]|uniref:Uncharacterized protein n=1 Tax=Flagellimonas profundi TaxID=2915620 RepID=A0ABS3FGJ3_9FLAO|nr:hypothetical protein [Allomuricauda profundi]MBO0342269.1 hypothetical protein [Allomuricauda profundi]MEC7772835.1 hypothetical protein [Bacteroidota bacterium]
MIKQKKNSHKKKYVPRFSPFFWRLGKIDADTENKDPQLSPVLVNGKESI